jgi:heat shock protein HtpX
VVATAQRVGGRAAGARNLAKCWLLVGWIAACFGGLGWLLGQQRAATLFGLCSLLASLTVYAFGDRVLLAMLGARPYALAEDPILRSTTDRLAAQLGVLPPRLFLIDDLFPRAFAVGRGPRSSSLAVSTGLLGALPRLELEAVLAHELMHVRTRDVLTQTFAVLLAVTLLEITRIGGWLSRGLLYVFAPVASAATHAMLSPGRELVADAGAAAVVGWENMADAILRLDRASELVQFSASPATEPLFTVNPFAPEGLARMFVTHPAVDDRIGRLRGAPEEPAKVS